MDTASLTERTLNFLKKYCHLDEPGRPITFVDGYTRQIDPVVVQRMRAQDRSWVPETRGNRVVDDYQAMQSIAFQSLHQPSWQRPEPFWPLQ